jgi:predicted ester cyclase
VVSGDKVVTSIRLTGTHSSDLLGIPATGKLLSVHGMVLSRLEDGKIIEEWEILDLLGMFRQLGVVSLPER